MSDRSIAFKQGWLVRHTAETPDAPRNPYPAGSPGHDDWAAGWAHAAAQIEAGGGDDLTWDEP